MYFDDLFSFDLDKYSFSRMTKDMHPYNFVEKDNKNFIVINALGISDKDINVEVSGTDYPNKQMLKVTGNTRNELLEQDNRINMTFYVYRPIESVTWETNNGLLELEISFKEPIKPTAKVMHK
jgi:HSP20 family molecular chaperone IbpA